MLIIYNPDLYKLTLYIPCNRMKPLIFIVIIFIFLTVSCEKKKTFPDEIIGAWRVAKIYDEGKYYIPQIPTVRVFKNNGDQILYDYAINIKDTCKFKIIDSTLILYRNEWKIINLWCWIIQDTLIIRHSGGWEYYDEYYHRIKF